MCLWLLLHFSGYILSVEFHSVSSVQSLSHVQLFATQWITARQASLSITNAWSLLKLISIESVMSSSHLFLCHPLLLLPPVPPSIRVFSNDSTLHMRWLKYWSFSFNISPSNAHPGLISFKMDWLELLAVQGTLKCLLQYHCLLFIIWEELVLHSLKIVSIKNKKNLDNQKLGLFLTLKYDKCFP